MICHFFQFRGLIWLSGDVFSWALSCGGIRGWLGMESSEGQQDWMSEMAHSHG